MSDPDNDCTKCGAPNGEPRYSFGVYAGRLCEKCCYAYRDNCGLDQPQGDPTDLEECYEDEGRVFGDMT